MRMANEVVNTSDALITSDTLDARCSQETEVFFQPVESSNRLIKKNLKKPDLKTIKTMEDRQTHIVDDVFDPIITQSPETIGNFIKPPVVDEDDKQFLEQENMVNMYNMIHIMETMRRSDTHYPMIVKTTFLHYKYLFRSGALRVNKEFMYLIKTLFHRYIAILGHTELIEIYNDIFTDKLYEPDIVKYVFVPTLTDEWKLERIKEYQESMQQAFVRKNAKKQAPQYEKDEIIGAKDKEGRWWMAKVLAVYEYNLHVVYYVEFCGWGEKFNEFISDGFRLQKFSPKKHRYFRPAWSKDFKLMDSPEDDPVELIEQNPTKN